jgi:hypothetical protein
LNITKVAQIFALLFSAYLFRQTNGFGYNMGDFFTNSSGHHDSGKDETFAHPIFSKEIDYCCQHWIISRMSGCQIRKSEYNAIQRGILFGSSKKNYCRHDINNNNNIFFSSPWAANY